jgi:tetratricopeptide (TPR) repeat protein
MKANGRISRARRQQISQRAREISALAGVRGRTCDQIQDELLRSFPGELSMGEARMYANGWTVGVVREGLQALAAEEGLDCSGLQDADVWRWLRGEVFPRDSLERLCRLFHCHQAQLGWPPRGRDIPIDFSNGPIDSSNGSIDCKNGLQQAVVSTDLDGSQPARWFLAGRDGAEAPVAERQANDGWDMKRRDFVRAGGIGLLMTAFPAVSHWVQAWDWQQSAPSRTPPSLDTLDRYENMLDECWALFNGGETSTAERVVRGFLPRVAPHAADQAGAAIVTARGLLLMGVIRTHQLLIQDKVAFCQQAVEYARQSGDQTTLVSALVQLAIAFRYAGQPANEFATHVEALAHADRAAPLVRSLAYGSAAAAFAQRSFTFDAERCIQRADQAFPADPRAEPHWLSTDYGVWRLSFHEGRALIAMGRPKEADAAFESFKQHPTAASTPERNHLEVLNERGRAAVAAGDLDLYGSCLRSGLARALNLGSRKRYEEAVSIYQEDLSPDWRRQPQISQIAEEFNLEALAPQA